MGLLDDAIREHLELKRRRGAESSEVARQEQEAFGPSRRGDVGVAPEPVLLAEDPAPTALHVVDAEPQGDLHPVQDEPPRPHGDPADELPHEAPHAPATLRDHEPVLQDEPPRPHGDPADALPHVDQPTRAFDADEVRAAMTPPVVEPEPQPEPEPVQQATPPPAPAAEPADDTEDEDVLEETPEFLQETPEHDRLWFEQRPPRDFDF